MLKSTGQPMIKIRRSKVTEDYLATEEIQNQNWQYFIERGLKMKRNWQYDKKIWSLSANYGWKCDYGKKLLWNFLYYSSKKFLFDNATVTHPATRRHCVRPNDVAMTSLYVPMTSQVHLKWNTQQRPRWSVARTSQWYVFLSYWYVVMTSHGDVMTVSHQYVSTMSQISLKWNTQWCLSSTSLRRLSGTYPPCPIRTSLRRLL